MSYNYSIVDTTTELNDMAMGVIAIKNVIQDSVHPFWNMVNNYYDNLLIVLFARQNTKSVRRAISVIKTPPCVKIPIEGAITAHGAQQFLMDSFKYRVYGLFYDVSKALDTECYLEDIDPENGCYDEDRGDDSYRWFDINWYGKVSYSEEYIETYLHGDESLILPGQAKADYKKYVDFATHYDTAYGTIAKKVKKMPNIEKYHFKKDKVIIDMHCDEILCMDPVS